MGMYVKLMFGCLRNILNRCSRMLNYYCFTRNQSSCFTKNQSYLSHPTWRELPDVAIRKIFGQLKAEERARLMVVSKSWKQILCRGDLPTAPELWKLGLHSYVKTSSVINFSTNTIGGIKEYAFKLPEIPEFNGGVWICGFSNGWLVMASKPKFNLTLFLWNPLTHVVMPLPPLSTLDFLPQLLTPGEQLYNISSYMKRVVIFSQECVVAVVFSDPDDDEIRDNLALCTPKDSKWRVFERDQFHSLSDILFHDGKLYALGKNPMDDNDKKGTQFTTKVCLSTCQVEVCVLWLDYKADERLGHDNSYDNNTIFKMTRGDKISEYLVELSGQLLVVALIFDLYAYNNNGDGPIVTFRSHQIQRIEVRNVDGLEKIESLGDDQTIALSDTGSFMVPSSVFRGECDGSIFFIVGHQGSAGAYYDEDQTDDEDECDDEDVGLPCIVREYGIIHLETNELRLHVSESYRYPGKTICGWHTPKFF